VPLLHLDIDLDILNLIEAERHSLDEPQYLALRRLLKLPDLVGVFTVSQVEEALPWTELLPVWWTCSLS
jgi:hypothetical protein